MKKAGIDFQRIEKNRISVLCQDSGKVQGLVQMFEAAGFTVTIETSITGFFSHLDTSPPGFVLLSRSFNSALGQQLPGFLQRKFNVPIVTFAEDTGVLDPLKGAAGGKGVNFSPEILHLKSTTPQHKIVEHLRGFEKDYQSRVEALDKLKNGELVVEEEQLENKIWASLETAVQEKIFEWDVSKSICLQALQMHGPKGHTILLWGAPSEITEAQKNELLDKIQGLLGTALGDTKVEWVSLEDSVELSRLYELNRKADNQLSCELSGVEMVFSIFHNRDINRETLRAAKDGFHVPLEDWIARHRVSFRLYLWLESNQKKVLYVKPGLSMFLRSFERFRKRGLQSMFIDQQDLRRYEVTRAMAMERDEQESEFLADAVEEALRPSDKLADKLAA